MRMPLSYAGYQNGVVERTDDIQLHRIYQLQGHRYERLDVTGSIRFDAQAVRDMTAWLRQSSVVVRIGDSGNDEPQGEVEATFAPREGTIYLRAKLTCANDFFALANAIQMIYDATHGTNKGKAYGHEGPYTPTEK